MGNTVFFLSKWTTLLCVVFYNKFLWHFVKYWIGTGYTEKFFQLQPLSSSFLLPSLFIFLVEILWTRSTVGRHHAIQHYIHRQLSATNQYQWTSHVWLFSHQQNVNRKIVFFPFSFHCLSRWIILSFKTASSLTLLSEQHWGCIN